MFSRKTIQLRGNLASDVIRYKPYPGTEFVGNWFINVANVGFESNTDINILCNVSCNFVTAQTYSRNGQVITYEQPLQAFVLKTSQNSPRNVIRFSCFKNNWHFFSFYDHNG